jgi:tetratricopeptide (TPR) repeat protein
MNKNKHLISKYLGGELDALTAARFEEDLKHDPKLRQDMELYKNVNEALADIDVVQLRMQLREMHIQLAPETFMPSKPRLKRMTRIALAASLALILGFSAISFFRVDSTQKILEKYYQPYELTSTNRSGSSDLERTLRGALEYYQNRQYSEAVVLFEKVLKNDPNQMATQFYSGISYYEIAEYQKAGKSFSKVIEHNDNLYIKQARWYLGFCYLKTEEKEKAIRQFTEIAKSDSYYCEKAKIILKKLR